MARDQVVGLVELGFDSGELLGDVVLAMADGLLGFAGQASLDAGEESRDILRGEGIRCGGPAGKEIGNV